MLKREQIGSKSIVFILGYMVKEGYIDKVIFVLRVEMFQVNIKVSYKFLGFKMGKDI